MNTPLPRWLTLTVLALLMLVGLLVLSSREKMDVYGRYLRETSPAATLRLETLSAQMDEKAVLKHFEDVPLRCTGQAAGSDSLGERVCYAAIDRADDQPALMLAAFFNGGRLVRVLVQMPWWVHGAWMKTFRAAWGEPSKAGLVSLTGGPVLRWQMPNGHVEFNARRSLNPLEWNVIVWTAQR